jgi:hypothetical protein
MFQNRNKLKPEYYKVEDPLLSSTSKKLFPILKGPIAVNDYEYKSDSYSNKSIFFKINPPSPKVFMSRTVLLKAKIRINLTLNAGPEPGKEGTIIENRDALRQAPLHSIIRQLTVSINGVSTRLPISKIIHPLLLYNVNNKYSKDRDFSMTPMARDRSQYYDTLVDPFGLEIDEDGGNAYDSSTLNPLNSYIYANPNSRYVSRGCFPFTSKNDLDSPDGDANTTIVVDLCEELLISPLVFGGGNDDYGFYGVREFNVTVDLESQQLQQQIWSRTLGHTLYDSRDITVTINIEEPPSLLLKYVTPPPSLKIPNVLQYPYNNVRLFESPFGQNFVQNQVVTNSTSNLHLNCIPRYLYIYVNQTHSTREIYDTNSYFAIERLNINWGNQNALLSSLSIESLYKISRKNLMDVGYWEFTGRSIYDIKNEGEEDTISPIFNGIGSVVCLKMGKDIPLYENESPGLVGTYNLKITVTAKNIRPNIETNGLDTNGQIDFATLNVIAITPGLLILEENNAARTMGFCGPQDVINLDKSNTELYNELQQNNMNGGRKSNTNIYNSHK